MAEDTQQMFDRLRAGGPEAEVWVRLRPPTFLEALGRGLQRDPDVELSGEARRALEWIVDRHADATWDYTSDDLRRAAEELVQSVAPVINDREEVARRCAAWAQEWSFT